MEITSAEAVSYEDAILAAIAKENRLFENDRGLAEYIHDEALKRKVYSLYPSVEIVDGELWGAMTAGLKEPLSGEETAELINFVTGQNSDGYGEIFEQRPIKTLDGEIYVSFWKYPALSDEIIEVLVKSDRKIEYQQYDLKVEK